MKEKEILKIIQTNSAHAAARIIFVAFEKRKQIGDKLLSQEKCSHFFIPCPGEHNENETPKWRCGACGKISYSM